jgi:hypothetical protein
LSDTDSQGLLFGEAARTRLFDRDSHDQQRDAFVDTTAGARREETE